MRTRNLVLLTKPLYKKIKCPHCKQSQIMEYCKEDKVWFPINPFCCEVMRVADSPVWNREVDKALNESNTFE